MYFCASYPPLSVGCVMAVRALILLFQRAHCGCLLRLVVGPGAACAPPILSLSPMHDFWLDGGWYICNYVFRGVVWLRVVVGCLVFGSAHSKQSSVFPSLHLQKFDVYLWTYLTLCACLACGCVCCLGCFPLDVFPSRPVLSRYLASAFWCYLSCSACFFVLCWTRGGTQAFPILCMGRSLALILLIVPFLLYPCGVLHGSLA